MKKEKPIYVLGTGLSHDGSACLLKDGRIQFAIEKERITRIKHDGHNDTEAINYCLQAEGITLKDIDLVVQNANFGAFEFGNDYFSGQRLFTNDLNIPVVTISHHLAHAFNAIGTSPFKETAVLVLDGCGSFLDDCMDLQNFVEPEGVPDSLKHLYGEKDSFYSYTGKLTTLYKDFSPYGMNAKRYPMHPPTTQHSIGGIYHAASGYCFGNFEDVGKLMGLAPYGVNGRFSGDIFEMRNGRVFVKYDWMKSFRKPARNYMDFWNNFQYYADIAFWVQKEVEKAILYIINSRSELTKIENLSYSGGVALNAVANALISNKTNFKNIYITPAAGDNGLAIGCAYYGWLEVLKRERVIHDGNSCFGKVYSGNQILNAIEDFSHATNRNTSKIVSDFFQALSSDVLMAHSHFTPFKIQFVIIDCAIYYLEIDKQNIKIALSSDSLSDAKCIIDGPSFIEWMLNPTITDDLLREGKLRIHDEKNYIRTSVNLEKISSQMHNTLKRASNTVRKISFSREKDISAKTAELLNEGKVIGWFQEGSEFGPRALGHRSIIADPRRADIQKFINAKIKFREDFRPFAPSVLREDVSKFFKFEGDSPYMLMVAQIQPEWREKIPGVVHKDGSCRIQTVTPEWNKAYFKLLNDFKDLTGVSVLLNTSFNKRGMPIVETPQQALSFFFQCALDCLVMGDYIIYKT